MLKKILKKFVYFLSKDEMRVVDAMIHARLMDGTPTYPEHLHYSYWENLVDFWDAMPSPVRPSRDDLEIYKSFLPPESKGERILILGSTPELRDLAAQRSDAKIYIADFSYRMPIAMLPFTVFVDPMRERWIRDNWLDLPFPENFFDIILGDLALQQFPSELELALLKKMQTIIKKGGIFIGRFHFLDPAIKKETLQSLIEKTLAGTGDSRQKAMLLKLRILWLFADNDKRKLNRQTAFAEFEKYLQENKQDNAVLNMVRDNLAEFKNSYRDWSPPAEAELLKILSEYLVVADRKSANDYEESKIYPIFSLKPKT